MIWTSLKNNTFKRELEVPGGPVLGPVNDAFMRAVAERRRFGLLTLAEKDLFRFIEPDLDAFIGDAFDLFVFAVAEGSFECESAGTP